MKWNVLLYGLLFSGLGIFSYLLLVNYTELTPKVADVLYSKGAFVFFITAFNVLGYSTLRISSWINTQYALNIRHRWKIIVIYVAVILLFLLLNYSLLIAAKLLAGIDNLFTFSNGGWRILIVVWLVELVIGKSFHSEQPETATGGRKTANRERHCTLCGFTKSTESPFSV